MFELFTVRARMVLSLAKEQAKKAGDDCVGTQHILFGLVKESSGIGHHILDTNGITCSYIIKETEKITQAGSGTVAEPPFTPRTKKAFEYAIDEATALGHRYVGTEHLFLGLLKDAENVAGQILTNYGLSISQLRKETLNILGFYDLNYHLAPVSENIHSVIAKDSMGEEVIGRYDERSDELLLSKPLATHEITRIIDTIKKRPWIVERPKNG